MTERLSYLPADYPRILVVDSMDALNPKFAHGVNCRLFPRRLKADFNALAQYFRPRVTDGYEIFPHAELAAEMRHMPAAAKPAARQILSDMEGLHDRFHFSANLRVIRSYRQPGGRGALPLHIDYATQFCAGYTDPMTNYVQNGHAVRINETDFTAVDGATLHSFRAGDMWVQAGGKVCGADRAFIHSGPAAAKGAAPRLILIGYPS